MSGQGHPDQWLAYLLLGLSDCDKFGPHTLVFFTHDDGGHFYSVLDMINGAKYSLGANQEFGWTLVGLCSFPSIAPFGTSWVVSDTKGLNSVWDLERIIKIELGTDIMGGACGGIHSLIGLTISLKGYQEYQKSVRIADSSNGVWREAKSRIDTGKAAIRALQKPSGSFMHTHSEWPLGNDELASWINVCGHALEFLALASDVGDANDATLYSGALFLCGLIDDYEGPLRGELCHALHGLRVLTSVLCNSSASCADQ